jgi:hypothetical protein
LEGITLIFLTLLSGVVLYLVLNQKNYQRVDYSHLITQEERERHLMARVEHAERMIGDLVAFERKQRQDMEALIDLAGQELTTRIAKAREQVLKEVLDDPAQYDRILANSNRLTDLPAAPNPEHRSVSAAGGGNPNLVRFVRSARQQQIAEMLELGFTHQEVSRTLGVSRHEVELVSTIIFGAETA